MTSEDKKQEIQNESSESNSEGGASGEPKVQAQDAPTQAAPEIKSEEKAKPDAASQSDAPHKAEDKAPQAAKPKEKPAEGVAPKIAHTDISKPRWFDFIPEDYHPYLTLMRLDRPIGTWLLLLPAWVSIVLASETYGATTGRMLWLMILFAFGAVIMRAAGCVINDMMDRKIDKKVERTKLRPIASGQVPVRYASYLLLGLLGTGFLILLTLPAAAILLGVLSLAFVFVYPLMKRFTYWPQAFLGLTFNFGFLIGWAAVAGDIFSPVPFILYAGGIMWTMAYDTIYAAQDIEDDLSVGVKSTPILFGDKVRRAVIVFMAICVPFWLSAPIFFDGPNWFLYTIGIFGVAGHFLWQGLTWRPDDQVNSLQRFKANREVGFLLLLAAFLAVLG